MALNMTATTRSTVLRVVAASIIAALSGCAVGPNFKRPAAPTDSGYGSAAAQGEIPSSEATGGSAQRLVADMDIPAQWWTLFQSPKLDRLVEQALQANPNVTAAQAALR
jgi:outer membrane protein TolC